MSETNADGLIPRFKFERLLNQDQAGRRIVLVGSIDSQPALLLAERAAFPTHDSHLSTLPTSLSHIKNLGDNDIYRWYLACTSFASSSSSSSSPSSSSPSSSSPSSSSPSSSSPSSSSSDSSTSAVQQPPDLKINLIYPCTEKHIKKYTAQPVRLVTETPEIYANHVRPFMQRQRDQGRLNWVFNIVEGRTEQEDVLFRTNPDTTPEDERFLLLPDLNWDRKTIGSLHLLALVERRDIWSLRDLNKGHVPWLKRIVAHLGRVVEELYSAKVEPDMLKFYVHYQPTYYHFHIHIVHVALEAGATQAVGKALSLDNIISQLATMAGDETAGMHAVDLTFTLGEASDLWTDIFLPLKQGKQPTAASS